MALIVGLPGNDTPLLGLATEDDEIFGDTDGAVNVAVGSDRIFGRGGNDRITGDALTIGPAGRGGDDLIQGGDGNDTIYGDAGVERPDFGPPIGRLFGIGGNDEIYGNAGFDELVGDAYNVAAGAQCGDDRLFGTGVLIGDGAIDMESAGGDDLLDASRATQGSDLHGDGGVDLVGAAVGGRDTLKGSAFDDLLTGDARAFLEVAARGGNDRLLGNGGDDGLYGDAQFRLLDAAVGGDDVLRGGAGNDTLFGDAESLRDFAIGGDDVLRGGGGDDQLWGDGELVGDFAIGGQDKFRFRGGFGDDTVNDFRLGEDQLVFVGLRSTEVEIAEASGNTVLTTLGDDSVTLVGFTGELVLGVDVIFA